MSLSRRTLLRTGALSFLSGCVSPAIEGGGKTSGPAGVFGETYLPGTQEYEQLRRGYNMAHHGVRPKKITLPGSADDVARALVQARADRLPVHLRSGGHSFEDLNTGPGVLLDLRRLNRVEVDPAPGTVTAGAGVKLGAIIEALAPHRLAIPTGSCPGVGVTGLTLGGGYGFLSRKLGLTCDALTRVELLDAHGRRWVASARQNADLFWALRGGGGGNFGVVTQLTFQAQPISPTATVLHARVAPSQRLEFLEAWQSWIPSESVDLTPLVYLAATPRGIDGPVLLAQFHGGLDDALAELSPLLPYLEDPRPKEMSVIAAAEFFGGRLNAPMVPVRFKSKSHFFKRELTAGEWAAFVAKLQEPIEGVVGLMLDPWRGAISDIAHGDTAFAHRDALFSIQYRADWDLPEQQERCLRCLDELYALNTPHSDGAYVNYCDKSLTNGAQAWHGQHLDKLREVKRRFDGENFFRHALSL